MVVWLYGCVVVGGVVWCCIWWCGIVGGRSVMLLVGWCRWRVGVSLCRCAVVLLCCRGVVLLCCGVGGVVIFDDGMVSLLVAWCCCWWCGGAGGVVLLVVVRSCGW